MNRILIVEDDLSVAEVMEIVLNDAGYETTSIHSGSEVMQGFQTFQPDLILLDLMLPGIDGITVCKLLREISTVPIIMLTAKSETDDVVEGLKAGADDYVIKPAKRDEILARIEARLRRGETLGTRAFLNIGDISIDLNARIVRKQERTLNLTKLEFDLLVELASNPGKTFSREELLISVWKYKHAADTRLVNVHIQRLRGKIEEDADEPAIILTVRGVGYRAIA